MPIKNVMIRQWYSRLSLRTKVSGISIAITTLTLTAVATIGILQIRRQVALEEYRSADAMALGFARAAELAMTVGGKQELGRLTASFMRDQNVVFIAAYGGGETPLASASRDPLAWEQYQHHDIDLSRCVVSQRPVEPTQADELTGASAGAAHRTADVPQGISRVAVGISPAASLNAQRRQNGLTLLAAAGAAAMGAIILFLALGKWMRRLQLLADASNAISLGNFSGTIDDRSDDEIGRLARSFDEMRGALRKRDQALRKFTETLQEEVAERTRDLRRALTAAEDANRAKSLFLANMSHELRTPLNGVIGMVDLLLSAQPNQQQRRYCDIAKASARSLVELINDILDFSKIEAGKLELDTTDFNLHEVVEGVTQSIGERAQNKGLELLCSISPGVPRMVGGDPVRLRQVILNLVSNAVKFTDKGEVVVDARVNEQTDECTEVRISIKDSGIGIPQERIDRLFKSFSQVDASMTRRYGGTGLGLAISQRIVEMMGGKIGVISEPGKGSTFWFTARLARRSQATVMRKESSVDLRGLRVLAVDDNQTNREILQSQLCNWSLRADIAVDASEAIGMLQTASEAGDPYRFAILDMHMPGTDGMQLAAAIKADPRTREVILISLSSISDQIKKEQMNAHGFAACLTKPVLPSQLYDTIVNSLAADEANENAATEAVAPPAARLDGVRVLLAEDNEVNRLVATELLQLVGCICTVAVNGQEAVDCALREEFDVILMDCQMPILDGFEATRRIREAEKQAGKMHHRMIVALTANAIKGDRELCLAAGMDDYVTKPIEPDVLMRTIGSLLPEARLAELAASGGKENCTTESGATPEKSGAPIPVDLESLQRRCVNNRKLAAKTLRLFDSGIDRDLSALTRSISEGDPKAIAAAAHKIKGAAANVSAESVRKAAAELEALGRNDALSQSQAALDLLQQEISHFRDYLSTALEQLTANEAGTITAAESAQTQASLALHPGLDLGH